MATDADPIDDLVLPITKSERQRLVHEAAQLGISLHNYVRSALGLPLWATDQRGSQERVAQCMSLIGKTYGYLGGMRRAERLTARRRREIARHAAQVRWAKHQQEAVLDGR